MKGKRFLSYALASSMVISLFAGMAFTANAETLDNSQDANDEQTSTVDVNLEELFAESEKASADEAIQELVDNFNSGFNEDGSTDLSAYDYQEGSEAEELAALSDEEEYPRALDLRHYGGTVTYNEETKQNDITGGKSYVTPVKFQNPWGTCWAFGITAAAETSVLSELDEAEQGIDSTALDFSEHHLAWFAKNYLPQEGEEGYGINDVNNQEGEGIHYLDETLNPNEKMDSGFPFFGASTYATGTGVTTESEFPYCGKAGKITGYRMKTANPEKYTDAVKNLTMEEWNADPEMKANYTLLCFSSDDDWTIDESQRFVQAYALEESSILPEAKGIVDSKTGKVTLNEDGVNAIKSELKAGRGVTIAYLSDGGSLATERRYINDNYAQYSWDGTGASHSVCIVGYDDDYDASNFGQETVAVWDNTHHAVYKLKATGQVLKYNGDYNTRSLFDEEGKEIGKYSISSDEVELVTESGDKSTPPGNGAWIVKNSWGSSDNIFPNKNKWGVDGSGYFYLSYYDTTICNMETYDFVVTDEETEEYDYTIADQYDYMPAMSTSQSTTYVPTMMANVFTASEDMEIDAVSCETTTPGTTVAYGICLLDDDEDYPSNTSEFEFLEVEKYTYGGYHRHEIQNPVVVSKGQKYAVIAMEYYKSTEANGTTLDNYYICSNSAWNKAGAKEYKAPFYIDGVINPGESYVCTCGYDSDELNWTDYYDFVTLTNAKDKEGKYNTYDNFSLKAYGKPTTEAAPVLESAVNTKTGVKVSWESKGTGYDYRLFMRESGTTKWNVVADTESTNYVVTGLTAGTSYDFTVCCMEDNGMDYLTPYDKNGVSCTYLPYVKTEAKAASSRIKLSWTKSAGASGYNIYRKGETSGYKLIGTLYNNSKVTYQDTTAKQGTVYTYKVKAFGNVSESASNTVSKVILKTPTLKVSSTKSKTVTVKWSKNTKATGYQIKYSVGSKIKVVKVKNAATVKKVLKKLKKGKICKVKVRSYKTVSGKTYFSNWSKLKKVKIK